jgi:hypothetical protein
MSSISSINGGYQNPFQQIRTDFTTLQTDLSSNNISGAQQAYTALTQELQAVGQSQNGQQAGGSSQIGNDLAAVGNALQSGSLSDAQSAFATLTQDLQSTQQGQGGQQAYQAIGHHHHHHHGGGSQTASTTNTSTTNDLTSLSNALQSGSLTTAQSAFATLMQDMGNSGILNNVQAAAGSNFNAVV